jgi:hypothetical protein
MSFLIQETGSARVAVDSIFGQVFLNVSDILQNANMIEFVKQNTAPENSPDLWFEGVFVSSDSALELEIQQSKKARVSALNTLKHAYDTLYLDNPEDLKSKETSNLLYQKLKKRFLDLDDKLKSAIQSQADSDRSAKSRALSLNEELLGSELSGPVSSQNPSSDNPSG